MSTQALARESEWNDSDNSSSTARASLGGNQLELQLEVLSKLQLELRVPVQITTSSTSSTSTPSHGNTTYHVPPVPVRLRVRLQYGGLNPDSDSEVTKYVGHGVLRLTPSRQWSCRTYRDLFVRHPTPSRSPSHHDHHWHCQWQLQVENCFKL